MTTAYRPQEMAVIAGDYNVPLPPLVQIDAASTTLPIEWVKKTWVVTASKRTIVSKLYQY